MRIDWIAPYIPGIAGLIFGPLLYLAARHARAIGQADARRERELRDQPAE